MTRSARFRRIALVPPLLLAAAGLVRAADIDLPVPSAVVYPGQSVLDRGVMAVRFHVPATELSAYVVERAMLENRIAKRTLLPNKPILLSDLKSPDAVSAGVPVTIVYREAGLLITGIGTPLRSAGEGELIRVRNVDSGVTISGTVTAEGTIEVAGQ